jgi:hypothetical protein
MFRYPTIEKLTEFLTREQDEGPSFEKIYDRARKQKETFNRQRQLVNKSNRSQGAVVRVQLSVVRYFFLHPDNCSLHPVNSYSLFHFTFLQHMTTPA